MFVFIANSVDDPEYGQGTEIEKDMFEIEANDVKRFFSVESVREFVEELDFEFVILDNKGTSHKDQKIGVNNLIRAVLKKRV